MQKKYPTRDAQRAPSPAGPVTGSVLSPVRGAARVAALAVLMATMAATAQGVLGAPPRTSEPASADTSSRSAPPTPEDTLSPAASAAPAPRPKTSSFRVYNIQDDKLLRDLWAHAGREGDPEPGRYQILIVTDPARDSVPDLLLMREGTQAGSLPPATQEWMRERLRADASQGEGATRTLGSGFWANFWNPTDWLAPYQWQTGLEAGVRLDGATFRSTTPLFGQHYDLTFTQRPLRWLTTEVGGHVSRHGGGLERNLHDPLDSGNGGWGDYSPWWHAAIGVPGVKWEVALSNREFPEYYWLDPQAGEGSYKLGLTRAGMPFDTTLADGVLMSRWRANGGNPKPSGNNVAHSLHLKAGIFRYKAHFDRDLYRSTIHQVMIEEIRAPFGQWALGFVTAEGVSHSRVRLDLFPWRAKFGPADLNARLRTYFLRVSLDYRDASTYHIGFSTTVHLDAPYLRPGDTP